MTSNNNTATNVNNSNVGAGQANQTANTRHYSANVISLAENGVTNTMVMNLDTKVIARNKDFSQDEEHEYIHISVSALLSALTSKIGRYLKYKVGNAAHKYDGVSSLLCLLYEGAEIEFDREFVTKGTVINGVSAKGDLWHTTNMVVKFKELSANDQEIANMLLQDIKPKRLQSEIKPLF
jgi:hypothetical protein